MLQPDLPNLLALIDTLTADLQSSREPAVAGEAKAILEKVATRTRLIAQLVVEISGESSQKECAMDALNEATFLVAAAGMRLLKAAARLDRAANLN